LAAETGAVNLGQAMPDFDGPTLLREVAGEAMARGDNQYSPSTGSDELRAVLADRTGRTGPAYDADDEVTVTAGATEGLAAALLGLLEPGDEVIVVEPYYDAYPAMVAMAGAALVSVPLATVDGRQWLDATAIAAAVTDRTRMIVLNTPLNPTGRMFDRAELSAVAAVAVAYDLLVLTD
nr:aminotransferase class I/II-fold pyridoxal phosphate-dependent enzyme [Micromonospora sp. DSM 115978]